MAGFDRGLLHDGGEEGDGLTVLPVGDLGALMVEELRKRGVEGEWGRRVVGLGGQEDGAERAWVDVEVLGGEERNGDVDARRKRYEADFVVGCDGGNSAVRKLLVGKGGFEGFTWDEQIVATNVSASVPCLSTLGTPSTYLPFIPCNKLTWTCSDIL